MSDGTRLRPPSGGMAPPSTATLPDGTQLDLLALAREITERHLARHPDELERYGDALRAWCTHDNQHLLNWAALDLAGSRRAPAAGVDLDAQLRWLAHVLTSRGYPLENLADDLRTAGSILTAKQGPADPADACARRSPHGRRRDARRAARLIR